MPVLVVTEQGKEEKRSIPFEAAETTIGRAEENAVTLASEGVSRRHASILTVGSDCFLVDAASENGTLLNGAPIQPKERYLLRGGDVITINGFHLHFSREDALEQSFNEITDSEILEVKLLKKVLRALDKESFPSLEVMNGSNAGQKIFFEDDDRELTIGREATLDMALDEYAVSRRHARLIRQAGGIAVEDLKSKNGTFVNKERVTEELVHDGDRIAFGTVVCIYRNPREIDMEAVKVKVAEQQAQLAKESETLVGPAPVEEEGAFSEAEDLESTVVAPEEAEEAAQGPLPEQFPSEHEPSYPPPKPARSFFKRLSPTEMGMLWAGLIILSVTIGLLVKLMS